MRRKNLPRFREGSRVKLTGFDPAIRRNSTGTVITGAGALGKGIYTDPLKLMVFVKWDDGTILGTFRAALDHLK